MKSSFTYLLLDPRYSEVGAGKFWNWSLYAMCPQEGNWFSLVISFIYKRQLVVGGEARGPNLSDRVSWGTATIL